LSVPNEPERDNFGLWSIPNEYNLIKAIRIIKYCLLIALGMLLSDAAPVYQLLPAPSVRTSALPDLDVKDVVGNYMSCPVFYYGFCE